MLGPPHLESAHPRRAVKGRPVRHHRYWFSGLPGSIRRKSPASPGAARPTAGPWMWI